MNSDVILFKWGFYTFVGVCSLLKGCSRGPHNSEKPAEAVRPEVKTSGERKEVGEELKPRGDPYIIQAPKPLEQVHRPRLTVFHSLLSNYCTLLFLLFHLYFSL